VGIVSMFPGWATTIEWDMTALMVILPCVFKFLFYCSHVATMVTKHPQNVPVVRKRRTSAKTTSGPKAPSCKAPVERIDPSPVASYTEGPDVSNHAHMADKSTTEKDDQLRSSRLRPTTLVAEQEDHRPTEPSTAHPQDVPVVRKRRSTTRKPKAVSGPEPPVEQEERLEQSPGASYIEVPDVSNQAQRRTKL
jgi:hypothetical protein